MSGRLFTDAVCAQNMYLSLCAMLPDTEMGQETYLDNNCVRIPDTALSRMCTANGELGQKFYSIIPFGMFPLIHGFPRVCVFRYAGIDLALVGPYVATIYHYYLERHFSPNIINTDDPNGMWNDTN